MKWITIPFAIRRRVLAIALFWISVLLGASIALRLGTGPSPAPARPASADSARASGSTHRTEQPKTSSEPSPSSEPLGAPAGSTVNDGDIAYLAGRNLLLPVTGVTPAKLQDTFSQARSEGRRHDAIDIVAPQGTPVVATTDGTVIKLFNSDRGGVTLYELDPSGKYIYYYAHLMSYAAGIAEGKSIRRGEVLAYVGDTGNAAPGQFHLHFAISKTTSPRKWSRGEPINPYPLLTHTE